jgi:hypothetical protein
MAFSTASISRPFHPNELLVAQSDRTLVRRNHTQANPPGTFRSVRDLIKAIQDYIRLYNKNPQLFSGSPAPVALSRRSTNIKVFQKQETREMPPREIPRQEVNALLRQRAANPGSESVRYRFQFRTGQFGVEAGGMSRPWWGPAHPLTPSHANVLLHYEESCHRYGHRIRQPSHNALGLRGGSPEIAGVGDCLKPRAISQAVRIAATVASKAWRACFAACTRLEESSRRPYSHHFAATQRSGSLARVFRTMDIEKDARENSTGGRIEPP